ncbi:MAG: M20/M25/M40 family metallo-hydrolase [Pseudomonadota bacterium]
MACAPASAQVKPYRAAIDRILASPAFKAADAALAADHARIVDEGIKLTEIPAPPFKEELRAKAFAQMLRDAGLADVRIDEEGNVTGVRKGSKGDGKYVVVSAHMDTVFPIETDVHVKRQGTKLMAPGIGDDSMSLAVLLGYLRAMKIANVHTNDDLLFVGTVGEEGPGDLRGVRYLFTKGPYKGLIKSFFSLESGRVNSITSAGVGSKRYRVTFHGPGGHSYGAFGLVNPMFALGHASEEFGRIQVPAKPRTTYSIGVIGGGTSVNSIPVSAWMEVDMRSESMVELKRVEERLQAIAKDAAEHENQARSTKEGKISVEVKLIGDRPAAGTDPQSDMVQYASASVEAGGYVPALEISSTDSNMAMSLGIPAITIRRMAPGHDGRSHSLDEWVDVEKGPMVKAMAISLATILAVAGME